MARGWRSLANALCAVFLFSAAARADEEFDNRPYGKPTREDLPNGGYKEVYKNKKGERVKEDDFDGSGVKKRTKQIHGYHPNGKEEKSPSASMALLPRGRFTYPKSRPPPTTKAVLPRNARSANTTRKTNRPR